MKKTIQKIGLALLLLIGVTNQINAQSVFTNDMSYSEFTAYGVPNNFDYTCSWGGGPYLVEDDPNGDFLGQFDKTFIVGGDCYRLKMDFCVMITDCDLAIIYEKPNPNINAYEITGVISNYSLGLPIPQYTNTQYISKYQSPGHVVYVRVIKSSGDSVTDYYPLPNTNTSSFYVFRGFYWDCFSI